MNTLGTLLLWCLLQVTLVALATMFAYLLARRRGSRLRSSLVLAGLITATLLIPLVGLPWPRWELPQVSETTVEPSSAAQTSDRMAKIDDQAASNLNNETETRPTGAINSSIDLEPVTWRSTWNNFVEALQTPAAPVSNASPDPPLWPKILLALFALAVILGLARLAGGFWSLRRTIRGARPINDAKLRELVDSLRRELGIETPIAVRETHKTATAATTGWRQPVILLPIAWRSWNDDQRRAVLAHELAHITRRDFPVASLAQLALALHFYHPLWQWLVARLRLEQELAADDLAANLAGGREPYLKTLAELALARSDQPVAWPARAFLPTRHTFLRRIEMLRNPKNVADRSGRMLRIASIAGLLMVGLVIAGVRPGAVAAQDSDTGRHPKKLKADRLESATQTDANTAPPLSAYISNEMTAVAVIHLRDILTSPAVQPFTADIKELSNNSTLWPVGETLVEAGLTLGNVETVALVVIPGLKGPEAAAFRTIEPIDRTVIDSAAVKSIPGEDVEGTVYYLPNRAIVRVPNNYTLLVTAEPGVKSRVFAGDPDNPAGSLWIEIGKNLHTPALSVRFNSEVVAFQIRKRQALRPEAAPALPFLGTIMPLINDTKIVGVGLQLEEEKILIGAYARAKSTDGAKHVAETIRALVTISQNALRQIQRSIHEQKRQPTAAMDLLTPIATQAIDSVEISTEGEHVRLSANFNLASETLGRFIEVFQEGRSAAKRARSTNNLKQIVLAFHNYHAAHGYFPPAVIEVNGVPHSWRVEILQFLGQQKLWKQYHMDEPWNSEHNKKILAQMPRVYRAPSDEGSPSHDASYYLLTSNDPVTAGNGLNALTLFTDKPIKVKGQVSGPKIAAIRDGTSNTILALEADRDVPWTKPEDIPIDPKKIKELKKTLGGHLEGGFLAALADGSVHFIPESIKPAKLKKLITPTGGEIIGDVP